MDMQDTDILIESTNSRLAEEVESELKSISQECNTIYGLNRRTRSSFGIVETIVISIVGKVAGDFAVRLIDFLVKKAKEKKGIKIELIDQDKNIEFLLPEQAEAARRYFENEENKK
jgi:ribosomal protein L5